MPRAVNVLSPTSDGVIIASWLKSAFSGVFWHHLWQVRFPRKQTEILRLVCRRLIRECSQEQ